jgi:predicted enzyme related to lactoylglutathione lyase
MQVRRLAWLGVRTDQLGATRTFFEKIFGMSAFAETPDFVAFRLPSGDVVELFSADDPEHAHFQTGPVAGFEVEDVQQSLSELRAAGLAVLTPILRGKHGDAWIHVRAPDGNVYELIQPSSAS